MNSIKLSHKSGKRDAKTCNFIIEVPALIRNAFISQGRVFLNWSSCPVKDFTIVTRCYKCQQYGHAAKSCRETVATCGHCGERGHVQSECTKKAEPPKCATCLHFNKPCNHKTGDAECPAKVLDMCAAPGSKTAQLIEFLHADESKMPTGFVIANDVDNSRCYMLVHQAKRLNSPCILITNHDSAVMPNMTVTDPEHPGATEQLKFDRVLCDVPCSGDGTMRKNPDIWTKWSNGNGNNLHGIQYRILKRGLELLSVGGRLVYSTCSLNPIENEAVVARVLREAEGAARLASAQDRLPALCSQPGMTHWRPASKDMVFYDSFDQVPERWQTVVRPQMFPPTPDEIKTFNLDRWSAQIQLSNDSQWIKPKVNHLRSKDMVFYDSFEEVSERWQTVVRPQMFPPTPDEIKAFNLDRCIRILPHAQDTGAFFVAVFEKTALLPWEKDANPTPVDQPKEEKKEPPKKRRRMGGYREDPFVFFSGEKEDVFPNIKEYYDLKDDFDPTCLLTRCFVGKKKNIYLVSPAVKDIVQRNEANIKIINTGVKTFVRCDNKNMTCPFRLSQEGLSSITHFVGAARRLRILRSDLVLVLQNDDPSNPPDVARFSEHTQALVKDFGEHTHFVGAARRLRILRSDLVLVLQNDDPSNPPDVARFSEHTQALVKDFGEMTV
ncbi:unnamed protein product [Plutella xylostella]|uniref:tRNA (cytosine(34)-C(5))-methyltransferase n=1 Tax=Plutella xylostella TaxID=51655 RepID=A0A8S4FTW0_PLUXY|nr:unnamed protein product [Plutella xylostella]